MYVTKSDIHTISVLNLINDKETMDKKLLLALLIAEYNNSNETCEFIITDEIIINDDATLYLFENDFCKSSAIGYSDGTLFVTKDWQCPSRPESYQDIADYDWCTVDWQDAIILDGLPKVFA